MKRRPLATVVFLAAVLTASAAAAGDEQAQTRPDAPMASSDEVNDAMEGWPAGPRLAAQEMMAKYGAPAEVTSERLIWHDAGPFARIMVTKKELPHNFPITHKDYLEHTINYKVPPDKTDELHAFDASITIHPGSGELSARCDLESNNVLTLNLANDIAKGGKSVEAARKEFGQAVTDRTLGKPPASTQALQFEPAKPGTAATVEMVTIAGSPRPADAAMASSARDEAGERAVGTSGSDPAAARSDAEVMALLIALDENEVHAAMAAQHKKDLAAPVLEYAKTLHREHGKNIVDTQQLALKIDVTPIESAATEKLHGQGAEDLAMLVPKDGDEFARGFVDQMVKGHREALQMIDGWMKTATNDALKKHLMSARQHIEMHLKQGEALQKSMAE